MNSYVKSFIAPPKKKCKGKLIIILIRENFELDRFSLEYGLKFEQVNSFASK